MMLNDPGLVEAELLRQHHLLDPLLVDAVFLFRGNRFRDRLLEEESEFHGSLLALRTKTSGEDARKVSRVRAPFSGTKDLTLSARTSWGRTSVWFAAAALRREAIQGFGELPRLLEIGIEPAR